MSFFDDVESTIADTRILQALRDDSRVELKLQPYVELEAFERTYSKKFETLDICTVETVRYYEFKRFMKSRDDTGRTIAGDWVELLEKVDAYAVELLDQRIALAQAIYDSWLDNLESATEAAAQAAAEAGFVVDDAGSNSSGTEVERKGKEIERKFNPARVRWGLKQKLSREDLQR